MELEMRYLNLFCILLIGCGVSEEIKKELISSVAYAQSSGITLVDLDPGDSNCPPGGLKITVGSQNYYVCNGAPGQNGYQGVRGLTGETGSVGSSSGIKIKDRTGNLVSNIKGEIGGPFYYWDGSSFWRIDQGTGSISFGGNIPLYFINSSNCSSTPFVELSAVSNFAFKNTNAISDITYWIPTTVKTVESGTCYRSDTSGCYSVTCPAAWRNITQVTTLPDVSILFAFPIFPVFE
jgi:hypothetical protein